MWSGYLQRSRVRQPCSHTWVQYTDCKDTEQVATLAAECQMCNTFLSIAAQCEEIVYGKGPVSWGSCLPST